MTAFLNASFINFVNFFSLQCITDFLVGNEKDHI